MRKMWRTLALTGSTMLMMLAVAAPPANAAPDPGTAGTQRAAAAVPPPSTSPAVAQYHRSTVHAGDCPSGHLCAWVDVPDGWIQFNFFYCGRYTLSHWHDNTIFGSSYYANHQTGGAVARFYYQNGTQAFSAAPDEPYKPVPLNGGWEPIWSLRPC
jgi:hypothetical protein